MNAGIVLALAGVWVGCQVLAGGVLERLGIVGGGSGSTAPKAKPKAKPSGGSTAPDPAYQHGPNGDGSSSVGQLPPPLQGGNPAPPLQGGPPVAYGQSYPAPNLVPQPSQSGMI